MWFRKELAILTLTLMAALPSQAGPDCPRTWDKPDLGSSNMKDMKAQLRRPCDLAAWMC